MPHGLDAGDRKLLIVTGALVVALAVVSILISPPEITGARGFPSSYSPGWEGAKGAFTLLKDLGYEVERWEKPPIDIALEIGAESETVLILAEPTEAPTEQERFALRKFLQSGGRIVATGPDAAKFLPEATPFTMPLRLEEPLKFSPMLPSPLIAGAPKISMLAPESWQPNSPGQLVVYGNEETAAVIVYAIGKGQVIWWAAPTPLTNGAIRDAGNLEFFLNSVGRTSRPRVLWDEYFHGAHGSLWDYFGRTEVPWAVVQFGLVFTAILVTYSRRFGPTRLPDVPSRLSPLEFVETLGDLYHSAHAGAAAVRSTYQRLHFMLTRRLGLPGNVGAAELAVSASRHLGWKEGPLFDTFGRSEHAMRSFQIKDEEALEIVQEISDYISRLQVSNAPERRGHTQ